MAANPNPERKPKGKPQKGNTLSFDDTNIAFAGTNDRELRNASWLFRMMNYSAVVDLGTQFTKLAFQIGLPVKSLVKQTIYKHFCGGESLEETVPTIAHLAEHKVTTILDYGVEAKQSEKEFEKALGEQVNAIRFADSNANVPYISCKVTGYATFELLEKLHKNEALNKTEEAELIRLKNRLNTICKEASELDVAVYIDAEESWIQDGIDTLVEGLMKTFNKSKPTVFNTVQLYRHDRLIFLKEAYKKAEKDNYYLGLKLVRGAYMEKERERAKWQGYPSPIHPDKAATDKDYDLAVMFCLDHLDRIACCIATHNEESCMLGAQKAKENNIAFDNAHLHFAQLYGMSDHISFNLAQGGYNASKYVPYGPVRDVIPYLIRRAEENSSVAGQMSRELTLIQEEIKRRRASK
ncbi:MAG: proline dehydrogenase [Limisphaerales bacterium]|jgi:proline dehydrogenase